MKPDLSHLADKWRSSIVARNQVKEFSGGLFSGRYLANLDSLGKGPKGRIRVGRQVAYRVPYLISWMEERCEVLEA